MLDFKEQNDKERAFFNQDFSAVNKVLQRVRKSLITGENLSITDLDLSDIINFDRAETLVYITLFQSGQKFIRYGSKRQDFQSTLNRDVEMLRKNKKFSDFDVSDEVKCRIMLEYVIDRHPVSPAKLNSVRFDNSRFEIGINGLELRKDGISYYYMPTDAITLSHMGLRSVLETLVRKTPIAKLSNSRSKRLEILSQSKDYEYYLFRSRAFITYKNDCIPLYRGNVRYTEFSYDVLYNQVIKSADWLLANMYDDGRFLYYYDCCDDTYKDHEHPTRPENNLYYNDLRHCGGIIALIRAYELTSDEKYIKAAKKAVDWSISISKSHDTQWGKAYYAFYNRKAKLGGTGVLLVAMMQYRSFTGDKSYDEYIKGYTRHVMSRVYKNGEILGYYIHPQFQNGQPLINMTDEERKETFSFYYPGEALLGLALFANNFLDDEDLAKEVRKIGKKALDWIVDERPHIYADLFTALPSDAWLMQAIEEWCKDKDFQKQNYINFVFTDAATMVEKTYRHDDSPYIDYEGGYYYEYGDHYFPDGARSEGLIAAYYLAKYLNMNNLAEKLLNACKRVAMCQFHLFNDEINNYSHKNPERSLNSIRFKATRQWVRVDSIQHVSCFFARLYKTEN
ncbi:hypothetical protein BHV42_01035 [Candidatus Melainabacteria bacterium MEL.A1]|nr:hypothetical protein BHV42_01035 [Candidatus Melainabacteria bacterium MEL.A1]